MTVARNQFAAVVLTLAIGLSLSTVNRIGMAGTISTDGNVSIPAARPSGAGFVHPGALETLPQLNFVKAQIQAGREPWASEFKKMEAAYAIPGSFPIPSIDARGDNESAQKQQAQRAYGNALAYWYTGDRKFADQAVAILKGWSTVTPYVVYDGKKLAQSTLNCSWMGALLGPAAELMRNYMSPGDLAQVTKMFKAVFRPSLMSEDTSNGNRSLTQTFAMFSISVFLEDADLYATAKRRLAARMPAEVYLKSDGTTGIAIAGCSWYSPNFASPNSNGLMQESGRDFGHHSQFALAAALGCAEVAWNQGDDLYSMYQDRYVAAMELLAKQITSGSMQGVCTSGDKTTTDISNTFEIGYNHFHNRKGISLPNTEAVLSTIRSRGYSDWHIFYETLTHAQVP